MASEREELLHLLQADRPLAHKVLFPHRHKDESPEFHAQMLSLLYDEHPLVAMEAFRGAAKSTYVEEYILLSVLFRDFVFPIIVGNSWGNACARLSPIKQELISNDALIELFGDQVSSPWTESEIGLANGAKIMCLGARQSMRGVKHNDERPDLAVLDDLEDEENVTTEEARKKNERWLNGVLRPALNPKTGKIRFIGTPLHPKALIEKKCNDRAWKARKFPAIYLDEETGEERSAWPDRFSMDYLRELRTDYTNDGNLIEFEQEYMCRSEDVAAKPFQASMIKVAPAPKIFMPVEVMVDPARTVGKKSARTGYAVWSWLGSKLYVHDAFGGFHKPDEIIETIFKLNEAYSPALIGAETDGLEEFLMQPLRTEQVKRGVSVPIIPVRAPKDKIGFITSLQPFYMAGDIIHTQTLPDLTSELLQFPTGRMDVPNALAYAPRMRAGKLIYDDFSETHISKEIELAPHRPVWLVVSTRPAMTAVTMLQYESGMIRVFKAWVENAPVQECLEEIMHKAIMAGARRVEIAAPAEQMDRYTNNGLPAAAAKLKAVIKRTSEAAGSEGKLTPWLRRSVHGLPAFLIHEDARWVINGMARGYARRLTKDGRLEDKPQENQYRVLLEALEAFAGWFEGVKISGDTVGEKHYAFTSDGRKYLSSRPG